ncbi:MAG: sugar phosphate isomerase/epimerase family protein [Planctomycetota bacterium]|jgi:sugar phosphate isomerase/epimerase
MTERISIVTDEISQDLGECREFLEEQRLSAVELRCVSGRRVPDLSREDRATLTRWVSGEEIAVLGVSPGLFKCDVDDRAEANRHLREVLPRTLDLAADLDARFLVAFAFENPTGRPADAAALSLLWSAAQTCAAAGLELLVENEPGFLAGTAGETKALLEAVDHKNLHANWDPLNSNELTEPRLSAGLSELFPHVRHVHVKNGRLRPGEILARCGPLGEGEIDWPAHLWLLRELEYEGFLGVETHFEPFRESSAIVLRELREICEKVGFWR